MIRLRSGTVKGASKESRRRRWKRISRMTKRSKMRTMKIWRTRMMVNWIRTWSRT